MGSVAVLFWFYLEWLHKVKCKVSHIYFSHLIFTLFWNPYIHEHEYVIGGGGISQLSFLFSYLFVYYFIIFQQMTFPTIHHVVYVMFSFFSFLFPRVPPLGSAEKLTYSKLNMFKNVLLPRLMNALFSLSLSSQIFVLIYTLLCRPISPLPLTKPSSYKWLQHHSKTINCLLNVAVCRS